MPRFFIDTRIVALSEQGTPRNSAARRQPRRANSPPLHGREERKKVLKNYLKKLQKRCAAISKIAKSAPPFVCKGAYIFLLVLTFSIKKEKGF